MRSAPDRVEELERKKQGLTGDVEKCLESLEVLKEVQHDLELKKKEAAGETVEKRLFFLFCFLFFIFFYFFISYV